VLRSREEATRTPPEVSEERSKKPVLTKKDFSEVGASSTEESCQAGGGQRTGHGGETREGLVEEPAKYQIFLLRRGKRNELDCNKKSGEKNDSSPPETFETGENFSTGRGQVQTITHERRGSSGEKEGGN